VLVVNRALLTNSVPDAVGGGTVAYVNPLEHRYITNLAHREEAGTPAIIESIRAGMVFSLKEAVGVDTIRALETGFIERALEAWSEHPSIQVLGSPTAERLSIVSFVIKRPAGRYLHHNVVVAILNDLFGIQSRGGCSCAGPYGHRLLGIDLERSHEFEREIATGCEGIKPGWVRVNFNYFISAATVEYIISAIELVADQGWDLIHEYRFEPFSGLWRHRDKPAEPPLRLLALHYDPSGRLEYTNEKVVVPEAALEGYLDQARTIIADARAAAPNYRAPVPHTAMSAEFERLRWFELPDVCLDA
jgi:Aminotransferase class-V